MEDELKATDRRWKEKNRQQKEEYREEISRLKERLEEAHTSLRIEREGGDQVGQKYEQQMKELRKVSWICDLLRQNPEQGSFVTFSTFNIKWTTSN